MIGEVILKNKLFSGESINIEYKVEMPKKSEKYMKTGIRMGDFLHPDYVECRLKDIVEFKSLTAETV